MRLYGALSELAELIIRLASGKTVKISSENQPSGASEKVVKIPDMGTTDEDKMVLAVTQQTLDNKTLTGSVVAGSSTIKVQGADITNTRLLQLQSGQQIALRYISTAANRLYLGTGTDVKEMVDLDTTQTLAGKTINASANTITSLNPASGSTFATVAGHADKVVKYDNGGIPQVAKIVNANIDDAAGIVGSKLSDNSVAVAKLASMTSADLAGKVTDETGSGALVFGTGPTLTNAKVSGYEDFNHTTTPGSNPTGAVRVYAKSDNKLYTLSPGGIEQAVGSGGSVLLINKATHGFLAADVGCPVYLNASGDYVKAQADTAAKAEVAGLINKIVDTNNFEVCLGGEVSSVGANAVAGGTLTPGEMYFLSPITAGLLVTTEPTVVGQISKPVGIARTASSIDFFNMRGATVGGANVQTQIALAGAALVSQTTNIQNVTAYTAGELTGWVFIDATTDRRFYIKVQFVKDASGAWKCAYQTTGDTPPQGFNVDVIVSGPDAFVQVQMPPVAGWVSGSVTFALNAPAVGATLPLQINSSLVSNTDGSVLTSKLVTGMVVTDSSLMFRNRIINGDMKIDQRNAGAAVTISNTAAITYVVDRFYGYGSVSSKFSLQRNAGAVTPPAGFTNYLGATSLSAYTAVSGDEFSLGQGIEGFNIADLAWGTASAQSVTISFWVRSSLTGTFACAARNSATTRSYVFTYSISVANTWEYKTVTIPGDTSGTWLTDNGAGMYLSFSLGAGATKSTTAGSWQAGTFIHATGATSLVGTSGATLYITGVQLESGSVATPFERRPIGTELQLCQRYCIRESVMGYGVPGFSDTTSVSLHGLSFRVEMRAPPQSLVTSGSFEIRRGGILATNVASIALLETTKMGAKIQATGTAASLTVGQGVLLANQIAATEAHLIISAEL